MKIKLKSIITLFVAAVFFTSCSSDDDATPDTQKPVITIAEPHNEDEFAPGSELHFEALFTDNVELRSYKIEIHDDFDDHTHAYTKSSHDVNPWSYEETFTIPAGRTSFDAEHHIDIPTHTNDGVAISEGRYHLGVFLTDAAGNQTEAFREIHIEGDSDHDHDH
jgi:hypothetical protein